MKIKVIDDINTQTVKFNDKITSIHIFDEKFFVGFLNGNLNIYENYIENTSTTNIENNVCFKNFDQKCYNNQKKLKLLKSIEGIYNNKGIDYLSSFIIKDVEDLKIIVFKNKNSILLFVLKTNKLELKDIIESNDDISKIELFQTHDMNIIAFSCKRTVKFYELVYEDRQNLKFKKKNEMILKDNINVLKCIDVNNKKKLAIFMNTAFVLVHLDDNFRIENFVFKFLTMKYHNQNLALGYLGFSIFNVSSWIIQINENKIFLIKDTQVFFLNVLDNTYFVSNTNFKFDLIPLSVNFIDPIYLLIVFKNELEILDSNSFLIVQKIVFPKILENVTCIVKKKKIYISLKTELFIFSLNSYSQQVNQFLKLNNKECNEFQVLDDDINLKFIDGVIHLISKINENDYFFYSDNINSNLRKHLMLRNLHIYKFQKLFSETFSFTDSLLKICNDWIIPYKKVLEFFPDFLNAEIYLTNNSNNKSILKNEAFKIFITDCLNNINVSNENFSDLTSTDITSSKSLLIKSESKILKANEIKSYTNTLNNLISFLTDQRRLCMNFLKNKKSTINWKNCKLPIKYAFDTDIDHNLTSSKEFFFKKLKKSAELIDTSLFLCYYHFKPFLIGPLLRLNENYCNVDLVKLFLSNTDHPNKINFTKELLELFFGKKLHTEALTLLIDLININEQEFKNDENISYESSTWTLQKKKYIVDYICKLSNDDFDIILNYSFLLISKEKDIIKKQDYAKSIFMGINSTEFDPEKVLEFLTEKIQIDELIVLYLEWNVFNLDRNKTLSDENLKFKLHSKLCFYYLNIMKDLKQNTKSDYKNSKIFHKFCNLLDTSNLYDTNKLLENIDESEFPELVVHIYKKLGKHNDSLNIFLKKLNNLDLAMDYADDIYSNYSEKKGLVLFYNILDFMILDFESNFLYIEKFLSLHIQKLSILDIIEKLPSSIPLKKISKFLIKNLKLNQISSHQTNLIHQLHKLDNIKSQAMIHSESSNYAIIDSENQLCRNCNLKLQLLMPICFQSESEIVHFFCVEKKN